MEFLRRLRIIWTALCVIAAVLVGIGYIGNPTGVPLAWFFAAVAAGVAFHVNGSWRFKLSVLWLGGFGLLFYGAFGVFERDPHELGKALIRTVALIGGAWCVAATAVWLFGGLHKPKNTS